LPAYRKKFKKEDFYSVILNADKGVSDNNIKQFYQKTLKGEEGLAISIDRDVLDKAFGYASDQKLPVMILVNQYGEVFEINLNNAAHAMVALEQILGLTLDNTIRERAKVIPAT